MKKDKNPDISPSEITDLQVQYTTELETNPQYSLEVDPENKYNMPEKQKAFIKYYVQFKNIPLVCNLCGIDEKEGKSYYLAYSTQQEIRRINLAMYHRQFSMKLLSIDEIGGYLTSMLIDENVPMSDRLDSKDKLKVAQMIIEINKLKSESVADPDVIEAIDITDQIKDLSVKTIKKMITESKENAKSSSSEKEEVIEKLKDENDLTPEEIAYLKTLPLDQIIDLLEKGGEENDN